jgi:hypothetical protein
VVERVEMSTGGTERFRLTERLTGAGVVAAGGREFAPVDYSIERYQGFSRAGMPIPGLQRIEGTIDLGPIPQAERRIGKTMTLGLADGRSIGLTLVDDDGRVLAEGHGPSRCLCC